MRKLELKVKNIFSFSQEKYFLIHVNDGEWDVSQRKISIKLLYNDNEYDMRYLGFGNINGDLVLKLEVIDISQFNEVAYYIKEKKDVDKVTIEITIDSD